MFYKANEDRYSKMLYRRVGKWGLKLPLISLGMWYNFGGVDSYENSKEMILGAFDHGITHFDVANNYGPPAGSAEETMGKILTKELKPYRDELIISTKAGYRMWEGPYGDGGNRKYLMASINQSLKRLNLDYVDIFYSHRFDPETPIEETMYALSDIVKQGKALYIGISSYDVEQTQQAAKILKELGTPCLIHQAQYSMFNRWIENGLLNTLEKEGMGCIAFSPLAQGLLTGKYLNGIPQNSRASDKKALFFNESDITEDKINKIRKLNDVAKKRNQTLAQMAIAWDLQKVTAVIIGARNLNQILENIKAIENLEFTPEELQEIDNILNNS